MAVLSDTDRARLWRGLMRRWSREALALGLTKAELRMAVDAADDWADANAAAYNAALPQPARGTLSTAQKAFLLSAVALARTSPPLARELLGEVD